jgi:alpha-amylase
VVTFVNNHDFRGSGEPIQNDPLLAYAYILTNNQIGLPTIFYPDFFGTTIPNAPVLNGQVKLAQLIDIHKNHIFGASEVVYLNRFLSSQFGDYQQGSPNQGAIYQLKGGTGSEAVIVAINFGNTTLKVDQEIDLSTNVNPGAEFTDLTGNAFQAVRTISNQNRLLIDVPARSYAVYALTETALPVELTTFTARKESREKVELHWSSALEEQQSHYSLEASEDAGRTYTEIYRVAARNVAANYHYDDLRTWETTTERLYRLRMVAADGQEEFSVVRRVGNSVPGTTTKLQAFPNPTTGRVRVSGINTNNGWELTSVDGRRWKVSSESIGDDELLLNLEKLPMGVYLLRSGNEVIRVVKQ